MDIVIVFCSFFPHGHCLQLSKEGPIIRGINCEAKVTQNWKSLLWKSVSFCGLNMRSKLRLIYK